MPTGIQWTDETSMIRADSGTIRVYPRKCADRPGAQLRRKMAADGMRWCRGCRDWLPIALVSIKGVCRTHANAESRRNYANGGKVAIAARVHARKRFVEPVSPQDREFLFEKFDGICAYCAKPADTIDHVIPVSKGGGSRRGNILPACGSCNSRKRTRPLDDFLPIGSDRDFLIAEELCMEFVLS